MKMVMGKDIGSSYPLKLDSKSEITIYVSKYYENIWFDYSEASVYNSKIEFSSEEIMITPNLTDKKLFIKFFKKIFSALK
jgi:hypothetical protein